MQGISYRVTTFLLCAFTALAARLSAQEQALEVRVSIADQRLVVLRDGMWTHRYDVSTSKFGIGDSFGSYKTPLGRLRVCDKIGGGLPAGSVMRHRNATGEVLPINARGRDPIVTRIIWLEGLEACNQHARARGIYIHGTVEEGKIGKPVSYGCIRMRSRDVVALFDELPVGTIVTIQQEKLPRYQRWTPPPPVMIAAKEPVKSEPVKLKEPVVVAATKPAKVEIEPVRPPSAATRLVIRANGTEDHDVRPSAFAADAFKSSILFADLPGSEPARKN